MSVRHAALWSIASQYGSFLIQFATSVVISRFFLAPDEVGLFSIALAAAMLVAVLQDFGLSRYLSGLPALGPEETARAASVALIFSLAITAAIAALAWPVAAAYALPALAPLLLVIAASYLFLPLSIVPLALMARRMWFAGHFAVNVGGAAVHGAVALVLAWQGFSAFALAWAVLAMGIARAVIAQWLTPARCWPVLEGLKPILAFGGWSSALYLTGALGSRTPDLVVGKLLGLFATGLFSRATSLAEQFRMLIAGAIGAVFYPAFARIRDAGEPLGPPYLRVAGGYSAVVWPGMAGLALAAEPLVLLLYGEVWAGVAPLLSLIALNAALMVALPMVSEMPLLLGRAGALLARNLVETVLSIALLAAGSLLGGVWGAAASRLLYGALFMLLYLRFMQRLVGFDLAAFFRVHAKSAVASLAAIAPLGLAYQFVAGPGTISLAWLGLSVAAGAGLWLAALVALRHPALVDLKAMAAPLAGRVSPRLARLVAAIPAGDRR